MATRRELLEVVGNAVVDGGFFKRFKDDPIAAVKSLGIELTQSQADFVKSNPQQLTEFIKRVQKDFQPAGPRPEDCGVCIVDGH
jgi:hypothetical protein